MSRFFCVEVERTVTMRRKVWVEVEETVERLQEEEQWPTTFDDEAKDAAKDKAATLTGWETHGAEYQARSAEPVRTAPHVDLIV